MRLPSFVLLLGFSIAAHTQAVPDTDHDGLNDAIEQTLLQQYAPRFMISSTDCSIQPAQFAPRIATPTVIADDSTIYGQATLHKTTAETPAEIELHYYHLWRNDCGRLGHALDAEHIAVLLQAPTQASITANFNSKDWHAAYWYAAAHEDTVCDASQITRATTLKAEDHGATIWISAGKHGSFLNEELCRRGCGGDRCIESRELKQHPQIINLGEWDAPMNGAVWMASTRWPLKDKITRSDFPATRIAMLSKLSDADIAWANPAKRPAQAAILGANSGIDGALTGASAAGNALANSGQSTDVALSLATDKTGNALGTATRSTGHAISKSLRAVRKALGGDKQK
jgi:hypothetical protein